MIELYKVSRTVPSGSEMLTILHPLDLTIDDAQFVAILGPSGSGKSTLLGLIAGLDSPSSGKILIDGDDITSMNEDELAKLRSKKIGFVFQSFHLVPSLTAFENILVPMEIAGSTNAHAHAKQLIHDVGLSARAHHYPSQLSGGEQQRIAIARAFANQPSILLADEPTGNLDTQNGQLAFELLVKMNRDRGTTLVLVTHEKELADQADRQIQLREGRIVEDVETQHNGTKAQREQIL
jgi:putative ABC transport system ATP-binding protein